MSNVASISLISAIRLCNGTATVDTAPCWPPPPRRNPVLAEDSVAEKAVADFETTNTEVTAREEFLFLVGLRPLSLSDFFLAARIPATDRYSKRFAGRSDAVR